MLGLILTNKEGETRNIVFQRYNLENQIKIGKQD